LQKLDPYLNVDPGTMSPYQHGEVFVTQDGAETDLDLGNYERFIDINLTCESNVTSSQIYSTVIAKERQGDFLGGTIQVVPHVTTEIKQGFKRLAQQSQAERDIENKGKTMRLGNYPCKLVDGSHAANTYGCNLVYERHRHRYEFNNKFRDQLEKAGMIYSGLSPDGELVDLCELANHPWMASCQFHPEFVSRPSRPHPLFRDFIGVAKDILREGDQPSLPLST